MHSVARFLTRQLARKTCLEDKNLDVYNASYYPFRHCQKAWLLSKHKFKYDVTFWLVSKICLIIMLYFFCSKLELNVLEKKFSKYINHLTIMISVILLLVQMKNSQDYRDGVNLSGDLMCLHFCKACQMPLKERTHISTTSRFMQNSIKLE